jgi:hypothetical protein
MLKDFFQKATDVISKNSPAILTGIGAVGLVTTVVLAVKATPKAICLIQDRAWEKYKEEVPNKDIEYHEWLDVEPKTYQYKAEMKKLGWKEVFKVTWKSYIPAAAVGIVTITCIIFSNHISSRRNAALVSLYTLTESAFKEYQNKIVETIGKNKELKVRDDISGDKIKENPVSKNEVIITGKGEVLCYDSLSGRYFKSDIEQIRKMINDLNRDLLNDNFVTLNEFYDAIGLMPIRLGDDIGWDVNKGMIDVRFSTQLSENDTPCLVLEYTIEPKYYS